MIISGSPRLFVKNVYYNIEGNLAFYGEGQIRYKL